MFFNKQQPQKEIVYRVYGEAIEDMKQQVGAGDFNYICGLVDMAYSLQAITINERAELKNSATLLYNELMKQKRERAKEKAAAKKKK